jgi:hypothetical protein
MREIIMNSSILKSIESRCIYIKNCCLINLPTRTKIFLSALWFWVYVTYIVNTLWCSFLRIVLSALPDSCVALPLKLQTQKNNLPKIILGKLGSETITNKLQLLINLCWDDSIGENGGVNANDLIHKYKALSSSVIWISYLFNIEKKLKDTSDEEIGKQIRYILVNCTDKVMHTFKDNRDESKIDDDIPYSEDLLFGDIPF